MSNGSKEFLSVEEIRERIRNRVRQATDATSSPQYEAPVSLQRESPALALNRFNKLRLTLLNANSAFHEVGAINPRPTGWTNEIIQLIKKVIRRTLSWLLRPIRQFDSAVVGSLNETTQVLEDFQKELRSIAGRIESLEQSFSASSASFVQTGQSANGKGSEIDIVAQIDLLQSHVDALAKDVRDVIRSRTANS